MTPINPEPVRLVISQFEDIVSHGLRALVSEDPQLRVVVSGVDSVRLAAVLVVHQPDVAIVNGEALSSPAELSLLHASFPNTRLVVLADALTAAESELLVGFGASACLAKSAPASELLDAIYPDAHPGQALAAPKAGTPLTQCETDMLELLRSGLSNAEIAATLHVGFQTVRTRTSSIYRKLGVSCRRELRSSDVAFAQHYHGSP